MYNVLTLNKIAACGLSRLGDNYTCGDAVENPDAVIVRSASMHEMAMPESLLAIARAGAGVNNIPVTDCADKGIVVFNTPGANANAVKELVILALLISSRKVVPAIEWAKTLKGQGAEVGKAVEKGKSQFVGPEIMGKKLGIIGLGAIGALVANAAGALGMEVIGYDPFLSPANAAKLNDVKVVTDLADIYKDCDYISIHVPFNDTTKGYLNADAIAQMKDGVRIINMARGELVDTTVIKEALANGKVAAYVVDFPSDDVLDVDGVIAVPHLGASTPESEDNCAKMAADEIKAYLETGSIKNAVAFPNLDAGELKGARICVLYKAAAAEKVAEAFKANGLECTAAAKKDYGYAVADGDNDAAVAALNAVDGVIKVRVIK